MRADTINGFKGLASERRQRRRVERRRVLGDPAAPSARAYCGVAPYGAGRVLRIVLEVRQPDGRGLAELDLDGKTGDVLRLHYRIETMEAGSVKCQLCQPTRNAAALFEAAALSLLRPEGRVLPGGVTGFRQVMEVASSLELGCMRALRTLQSKPSHRVLFVC